MPSTSADGVPAMSSRQLVYDQNSGRVGEITATNFSAAFTGKVTKLYLRPPKGGTEWPADPADVRPATLEELAAEAAR